jgi:beta-galactosidase
MYPKVSDIIAFANKDSSFDKPLILCEFVHAMGNGPGAIKEYIDAFYRYPRLQGGFAWEWANHGLKTKASSGEEYYAYGGDFGDVPNDGNFVMDGLTLSDHTATPGLIEYKKAIEPVQIVSGSHDRVKVINRYDFITLDHLNCRWTIDGDGFSIKGSDLMIPKEVQPGQIAEIMIGDFSLESLKNKGEAYLRLVFTLKESTAWAPAGHEIAWGQIKMQPALPHPTLAPSTSSYPKVSQGTPTTLLISNTSTTWKFDLLKGTIISWIKGTTEVIHSPPTLDFYRPLTDNDRPSDGAHWLSTFLNQAEPHTRSVTWTTSSSHNTVNVTVQQRIAPPVLEWSVDTVTTYTFTSDSVHINIKGVPQGINMPETWARIGLTLALRSEFADTVTWFGRGPGESYVDKKMSQRFGTWQLPIEKLWTPYEFPQESGNRTDVRRVRFHRAGNGKGDEAGLTARFGEQEGCSFTASHYRCDDIDAAKHPFELERMRREEVIVRLDWRHHGLGTGSCGPKTLEEYALKSQPFDFDLWLE